MVGKEDILQFKNFVNGLVSDGEDFPLNSVQDCNNLDFEAAKTRRRMPYHFQKDLSAVLPSGYKILGLYNKIFTDAKGNENEVLVLVAKNESNETRLPEYPIGAVRIYVSKYNNPDASVYGNGKNTLIVSTKTGAEYRKEDNRLTVYADQNFSQWIGGNGFTKEWEQARVKIYDVINQLNYTAAIESIIDGERIILKDLTVLDDSNGILNGYDLLGDRRNEEIEVVISKEQGWVEQWTELTEQYYDQDYNGSVDLERHTAIKIIKNIPGNITANDYFKSWFLFDESQTDRCWGTVTKSTYGGNGTHTLYIALNAEVKDNGAEAMPRYTLGCEKFDDVINQAWEFWLCRFPVNSYNRHNWKEIEECSFEETPNAIKIALGDKSRIVELSYLADKKYFGAQGAAGTGTGNYKYLPAWDGFWFAYDIPNIAHKDEVDIFKDGGIDEGKPFVKHYINYATKPTHDIKWNNSSAATHANFFKDVTYPYPTNQTHRELGLIFNYLIYSRYIGQDNDINFKDFYKDDVFSSIVQVHGYQSIFTRMCVAVCYTSTNGQGQTEYWKLIISPEFNFGVHFDRRISAIQKFFLRGEDYSKEQNKLHLNPFQLVDGYGGNIDVSKDSWYKSKIGNTIALHLNSYNPINSSNSTEISNMYYEFMKNPQNTGLSVKSYLNMNWEKDIWVKAKKLIKSGDNFIALGLSDDSVATNAENDRNGAFKVAISNIQNTGINTPAIYSDERVRQITTGDKLITGAHTINEQFLLFTNKDCYYYSLADGISGLLQRIQKFDNYGTYNNNTIVRAQVGGQYAGVYWIGKSSIYRFLDNYPEDMLEGRWKGEFEAYSEEDKAGSIMGILPRTRDVFVVMRKKNEKAEYSYQIYVWSVKYQNWRKYAYTDVPKAMVNSKDEEMYFLSGTNGNYLFKTATPLEAASKPYDTRDNTPTKVQVAVMLQKILTHGSRKTFKTFSRVEMAYDHNASTGKVKYTARSENSATDDLLVYENQNGFTNDGTGYGVDTVNVTAGYSSGNNKKARKACRWYSVKIETSGTELLDFIIDEIFIAAELRGRTLNR